MHKTSIRDRELAMLLKRTRWYVARLADYDEDADDIVQDVMLRVLTSKSVPEVISKAWLYTVCRHVVFSARRKRKQERPSIVDSENRYGFVYERNDEEPLFYVAEYGIDEDQRLDASYAWNQLMQKLSLNQRTALVLSAFGASYDEIARIMKSRIGTVRSRLHYARKIANCAWQEIA